MKPCTLQKGDRVRLKRAPGTGTVEAIEPPTRTELPGAEMSIEVRWDSIPHSTQWWLDGDLVKV